jgi:pimeloyl-ACP methyl ester carboxylesterase
MIATLASSTFVLQTLLTPAHLSLVQTAQDLPRKAALGSQLTEATSDDLKGTFQKTAAKVVRVLPDLTAQSLGLKDGDVILKLNDQEISASKDVIAGMRKILGGQELKVEIWRPSEKKVLKLRGTAKERPKQKDTSDYRVLYQTVNSNGKKLRVITTIPNQAKKSPAIFLIGGIGSYSVDGEFAAVPYGSILESFAKNGYATIRIDKPGQGDSEGPDTYTDLTFDVESDAYLQALRFTKQNESIQSDKIVIFGHSMGGCFGPVVASQEPVRGIAVYGTVGKSFYEYTIENERRQGLLAGSKPDEVEAEIVESRKVFFHLFEEGLSLLEIKSKYPDLTNAIQNRFPDGKTYSGVGLPFFQQLAKKNLMSYWAKTSAKTLVMYGENDFISGESDHRHIADSINAFRPGNAEFKLIPRSDHGFFETTSPRDSMVKWGKPGNKVNPAMLTTLTAWVKATTN